MQPVSSITVLFDSTCGLCTRAREWLGQQEQLLPVRFVPVGSPEAQQRFPQVSVEEFAVVANTGEVWLGNHAWIVCLWALRGYRDLAFRFTSPLLLTLARNAYASVSRNRHALSSLLQLRSERELEQQLRKIVVQRCHSETK